MNQIKFDDNDLILLNQLIHLTHIDISHNNRMHELDLRSLNTLEQIHCSYNNTSRLVLNGHALKQLNASHNSKNSFSCFSFIMFYFLELKHIDIVNPPLNLVQLDISS
jgi:Leucine-rich repeat (LRR) protein